MNERNGYITVNGFYLTSIFEGINLPPSEWLLNVSKHPSAFYSEPLAQLLKLLFPTVKVERVPCSKAKIYDGDCSGMLMKPLNAPCTVHYTCAECSLSRNSLTHPATMKEGGGLSCCNR